MTASESNRPAGVVYTRPWVADLMLDLVGYEATVDLGDGTIVDPGCGDGAIILRAIPRLLSSAKAHGRSPSTLVGAVRAYDIDPTAVSSARTNAEALLESHGVPALVATSLAESWIRTSDFLLDPFETSARWIVGNPPYVRVEEADPKKYGRYRDLWTAMSGRADIYVGFFQAALDLLEAGGRLCFICADRWMHNQYGASLRRYIIENHALRLVLEVHESDVFDQRVAAYPAITVIDKAPHSETALATGLANFDAAASNRFVKWWRGAHASISETAFSAAVIDGSYRADTSWPSGPPERLRLISTLEASLPSLVDVGITVGVGMATGADDVYVVSGEVDVEPELIRMAVGPSDLKEGAIEWTGRFLVAPWIDGDLIDLERFPRFAAYIQKHAGVVKARYVAAKRPETWWRTIDRPPSGEYAHPKLIVADINDRIEPILDLVGHWPLHSVYFIESAEWELEALGGYLISDVAAAFVEAYSVKMANGHLRVSAQYLKKIRIPRWERIDKSSRRALSNAFRQRDRQAASLVARRVAGLPSGELAP